MDSGIIGVMGTVLGVLISGPITYYFAKKLIQKTHKSAFNLAQRQDFNKAANKFHNAFTNQLNFLEYNANAGTVDTSNIGTYLNAHYIATHLNAFRVFKNSLSDTERVAIDEAWEKYRDFKQYYDKNNQEKMKALALKRLNDVLEFAKHK